LNGLNITKRYAQTNYSYLRIVCIDGETSRTCRDHQSNIMMSLLDSTIDSGFDLVNTRLTECIRTFVACDQIQSTASPRTLTNATTISPLKSNSTAQRIALSSVPACHCTARSISGRKVCVLRSVWCVADWYSQCPTDGGYLM
jgi:hypothetical protein